MRECFRPYSKKAQGSGTFEIITLQDTIGTNIYPNYIQVECSGPAGEYFNIFTSPDTHHGATNGPMGGRSSNIIGTGVSTSAVLGEFAPMNGGVITLSLEAMEKPELLIIRKSSAIESVFFVTYGNVLDSNSRRDATLDRGV